MALWVPRLLGETVVRAGIDSRVVLGGASSERVTSAHADAGYRLYFDDIGQFGVGVYATGLSSLPLDRALVGLGGGASFQYRAMGEDFIYAAFASFVEAGAVWGTPETAGSEGEGGSGLRLAFGTELGPGLLWWLDPFLFGESTVRFGLEYTRVGGMELTSVLFGWTLSVDVATRAGGD